MRKVKKYFCLMCDWSMKTKKDIDALKCTDCKSELTNFKEEESKELIERQFGLSIKEAGELLGNAIDNGCEKDENLL